jgi:glycosyltransferase involved in cell wall biosynthesis
VGRKGVRGSSIVVHTPQVAELMKEVFGDDRVFYARYPVEATTMPLPAESRPASEHPVLAFIGGARHEKGLDLLADAVGQLGEPVTVRIIGPQPPGTETELGPRFGHVSVDWRGAVLSVLDLRAELAECTLAVLPYRRRFGLYGGSSASLLDAMAAGVPVVVSPAISDQVAPGYGSVTVTKSEDPTALADAIRHGLGERDQLAERARIAGPAFLTTHHSVSAYVDTLTRAAAASAE